MSGATEGRVYVGNVVIAGMFRQRGQYFPFVPAKAGTQL